MQPPPEPSVELDVSGSLISQTATSGESKGTPDCFPSPPVRATAPRLRVRVPLGANRPVRGPVVGCVQDRFRMPDSGFPPHAPSSLSKPLQSPLGWRLLGTLYFRSSLFSMTYSSPSSL